MTASTEKLSALMSIVVLESTLPASDTKNYLHSLSEHLNSLFTDYEVVIVGDAKSVTTKRQLREVLEQVPCIRFLELSYRIDTEVALTAGLENAIGDFVLLFDPTHDPMDVIEPIVKKCLAGCDIVVGVAKNPVRTPAYKTARLFVNPILKEIGYSIPRNATNLRCLSRPAIQSSTKGRNFHHLLFSRIAQCGLDSEHHEYSLMEATGARKGLSKAARETMHLLVFNSTNPLRWMSTIGIGGSMLAFFFASYSFISKLVVQSIADGWSSLVIFISFLFMLLFVMLSFFGEYLGRLLNESSNHEPYWIVAEKQSRVMLDTDRRNVTSDAD